MKVPIVRIASFLLPMFFAASNGYAQNVTNLYKYQLEDGKDKEVCVHMAEVFNQKFRTPWDRGDRFFGTSANPVVFGKTLDQAFDRLPGAEFDKMVTYKMLLSRYPSSPEFDAVVWKEGRVLHPDGQVPPHYRHPVPMLTTEVDIDNDGQKDWVVKHLFMFKMPTNVIYGAARDHDYSGRDELGIFPPDGLDLTKDMTLKQLAWGQNPDRPPRRLGDETGLQLRPFIYKGKTYLSAYKVVWHDEKIHVKRPKKYRIYPDHEYLNVLKVLPGGQRIEMSVIETANTEIVCRIRMIMLNDAHPLKGN